MTIVETEDMLMDLVSPGRSFSMSTRLVAINHNCQDCAPLPITCVMTALSPLLLHNDTFYVMG